MLNAQRLTFATSQNDPGDAAEESARELEQSLPNGSASARKLGARDKLRVLCDWTNQVEHFLVVRRQPILQSTQALRAAASLY
jgi:hypothetical protein